MRRFIDNFAGDHVIAVCVYWTPTVFAASCSVKNVSAFAGETQSDKKKTSIVVKQKMTLINPPYYIYSVSIV